MQTIVDKVVKKRCTPLKKAILKKRELDKKARLQRREERKRDKEAVMKATVPTIHEEETHTDGYITIDDEVTDTEPAVQTLGEPQLAEAKKAPHLANSIPYRPLFHNLETIFDELALEMCR